MSGQIFDRVLCYELLKIARESLCAFVLQHQFYRPDLAELPRALREPASTFVTLYDRTQLRGCIGSTRARLPLALDVARNAAAAARDPRFSPVLAQEVELVRLEVSVLYSSRALSYDNYKDLLDKLHPGVDGVMIGWHERGALLLPQVWERLPEPARFLQALCEKAQIPEQTLRAIPPEITVLTFEAYSFNEDDYSQTD